MRLLVFGQTGQVARELIRRVPADVSLITLGRGEADLSRPETCAAAIRSATVDAVINAAACTAVDRAEAEETEATIINGAAPAAMAIAAEAKGIPVLHISTDYVFDGAGDRPFLPGHSTGPLGAYGRSKLAGEQGVRDSGARHLILRTSWVVSSHGSNFVKTMLRLGSDRSELNVVADQIGGPTPAAGIADAILTCARALVAGAPGGTFHYAGEPDVSWADFARAIMAAASLPCAIRDIPTSDYPTPALRPQNSRLDCASLTRDFGIARPDWRVGLVDILSDLKAA